jgi:multicomponent K+:H+ antiporter subunit A
MRLALSLTLIVVLPFIGSLCAAFLPSNARNAESWLAGLVTVACTALVASLYPHVVDDGVIRAQLAWAPQLGLEFYLRMDGYAWLFALLVALMGALVVLYARYYMSPADPVPRFFSFLMAFMGAMLGIVLSGNLIQLVVFWELTSLTSFMLIAYWYHRAEARRGARMAILFARTRRIRSRLRSFCSAHSRRARNSRFTSGCRMRWRRRRRSLPICIRRPW